MDLYTAVQVTLKSTTYVYTCIVEVYLVCEEIIKSGRYFVSDTHAYQRANTYLFTEPSHVTTYLVPHISEFYAPKPSKLINSGGYIGLIYMYVNVRILACAHMLVFPLLR